MSTTQVVDTHRLMYRNARLRAISLSDKSTPIQFLNVTDENVVAEIGNIVYTDSCGYVFYGNNQQRVSCLAVPESAIIQVDLNNNGNWNDIEWIVRVADDTQFVRIDDIGKVFDKNGNLLWNPLAGNWQFPDFMRRDEFTEGEWAEGEMTVTVDTPYQLNVDKWTHTIIIRPGHANEYGLPIAKGRPGQCIAIVNASDTSVTIKEIHVGGSSTQSIGANGAIIAVRSLSAKQWVLRAFDKEEHIVGTRDFLSQYLSTGNTNTWISEAQAKINDHSNAFAYSGDGFTDTLPPKSIALTATNKVLYVMNSDGLIVPLISSIILYGGSGVWRLAQRNAVPSPSHIAKVAIDENAFPQDHPFGSYSGVNDLHIDLQMCIGETLHVFITVPTDIDFSLARDVRICVNECEVFTDNTATLAANDRLVSGRIERAYDEETNDTWYFWTPDSEVAKAQ